MVVSGDVTDVGDSDDVIVIVAGDVSIVVYGEVNGDDPANSKF